MFILKVNEYGIMISITQEVLLQTATIDPQIRMVTNTQKL